MLAQFIGRVVRCQSRRLCGIPARLHAAQRAGSLGTAACCVSVLAGTPVVWAAPREVADLVAANLGPIPSNGLAGHSGNRVISVNFTGLTAGGQPYEARRLLISGAIGSVSQASWLREACILVRPPATPGGNADGPPFIINPFVRASAPTLAELPIAMDAGRFALPIPVYATAGTWRFEFFDNFDDNSPTDAIPGETDATWSSFVVTLDDELPVPPASPPVATSVTWLNVPSDGTSAGVPASSRQTFVSSVNSGFNAFRLQGSLTAVRPGTGALGDFTSHARIRVRSPQGLIFETAPFVAGFNNTSTASFASNTQFSGVGTGTWQIDTVESNTLTDQAGGVDSVWNDLTFSLVQVPPPASQELGTLAFNTRQTTNVTIQPGEVRWLKFTLPNNVNPVENRALRIDTEGSLGANPSLGIYNANGFRLNSDLDDGSGLQAQLTFGADAGPPVGDGQPYNGRDLTLSTGIHYLAVTNGDATFNAGLWDVVATALPAAAVQVNIEFLNPGLQQPASPIDYGTLTGFDPFNSEFVIPGGSPTQKTIQWFRFRINRDASTASGYYIDLDTVGSTRRDTELAIYNSAPGTLLAENDDSGPDLLSQISIGGVAPRAPLPAIAGVPGSEPGEPRLGTDAGGALVAGEYFVVVASYDATFTPSWGATSAGIPGFLLLNIRSNMQRPTGNPCGLADIGTSGGASGRDNNLDNNDFIVFINHFFAQQATADIGSEGGTQAPDGAYDNNDFIVFINAFFAGSAAPGCNGNP
jgi:hypothetical protein